MYDTMIYACSELMIKRNRSTQHNVYIELCMQMFNCPSIDLTVAKRKVKF